MAYIQKIAKFKKFLKFIFYSSLNISPPNEVAFLTLFDVLEAFAQFSSQFTLFSINIDNCERMKMVSQHPV
jgi:hypothetical protein